MTEHRYSSECVVGDKLPEQCIQREVAVAQPRMLTTDEITAVAGGPAIQNETN